MTTGRGGRSVTLRAQILLMLLGGAILPLGLVGLWLTSSAVRSGEELLRGHLEESAQRFASAASGRWEYRRADLALIAENDASIHAVTQHRLGDADRAFLGTLAEGVARTIPSIELRDTSGAVRWSTTPSSRDAEARARGESPATLLPSAPVVRVETPIMADGRRVGTAIASVALTALVPSDSSRPFVPGGRVAIRNWVTGTVMEPFGVTGSPVRYADGTETTIANERWLVARQRLEEPTLEIAVAAATTPYVAPFRSAARVGVGALLAVSILAILLTAALATRATRPLEELARASAAVQAGTLDLRVAVGGPTEVRQVGDAFNVMTENLRATLETLSRRSALAAVGEFATSLSHDVRNALTSIKVDLERLSLRGVPDPVADGLITRALSSVARLETSVAGALRVARRGHAPLTETDLRLPIRAAAETVAGTVNGIPATLDVALPDEPVLVRGDAAALQQLFANLLFNAAQALKPGGRITVAAELVDAGVVLAIADTGSGITEANMARLATPFFSSKANGTGLGLPIARQIVAAHGGELTVESSAGVGTTVRVRLPVCTNRSPVLNESANKTVAAR